jgi:hypothetical protein
MRPRYRWLLLLLMVLAGCNRQDTEALARISKKLAARSEALTGDLQSSAATSWQGSLELGIAERVTTRLRWDKQLADATFEVAPLGTGVELRGKVRNLEQRRRAVMLAESTSGVDGVKDSLVQSDR